MLHAEKVYTMKIKEDRPNELYIPRQETPLGFRFLAGLMLDALKDFDCSTSKSNLISHTQHTPKGDYIQVRPNDPDSCIYACHVKAICQQAAKDQVIDAEYTKEGLMLSYDNTRFNLKWQAAPKGSFTAHLITGERSNTSPAPDAWLQRACSTDKQRESLAQVYGNVSSDGSRLHIDTRLEPSNPPAPYNWECVVNPARKYENIAILQVKPLVKALKQAKSINKESTHLSFNRRLEIIARSEETGESMIPIETGYQYTGQDAIVWINNKFLLDALSGFTDEVMLCLGSNPPKMPVYLTDGTREAVIMPIIH